MIFMDEIYEPPKATIYRFDENDRILTASGESVHPLRIMRQML